MTEHPDLPASLRAEVAPLLARYLDAGGTHNPQLPATFAKSPFIAAYAASAPAAFTTMIDSADTARARSHAEYCAVVATTLAPCTDLAQAKAALRRLRRAEFVRIAWRDLVLGVDVVAVMAELSAMADAVVTFAVDWIQQRLAPRFGRAVAEDGTPLDLLVVSLGKLGGGELNFSSDIDLMFVYETAGTTLGGRQAVDHQDYFDRVGRELIALLHDTTAEGLVFRVDMRLRPFGESGALTSSLAALEQYYTVHGRDWERYALIKARALGGNTPCRRGLDAIVRPFVFRRYLDYGALDALREMKHLIEREARADARERDIKRGHGGIREIEFTAQLFQLTRGGREARLRQAALLPTLAACAELGLLTRIEVAELTSAYRFLRMTEHRLQQMRDEQTHALPIDERERARLAFAAGFPEWHTFSAELTQAREATSALFAALLRPANVHVADTPESPWRALWRDAEDAVEQVAAQLALHGRTPSDTLAQVVVDLKSARFQQRLSQHGRARLDRIMPRLLELICTRPFDDATAVNVAQLLRAIAGRSVYLAFLADNPAALARLLELFAASRWIAEQITRHPILLDELLDPRALFAPPDQARLHELLAIQIAQADDLEAAMDGLRNFRNQHVLRVAASDVTGQFPIAEVSNQLTYIAEACLAQALTLAWRDLVARYGEPRCCDERGPRTVAFAIIGYGKLGGWELGYSSDLDLVLIHDSAGETQLTIGPQSVDNEVFFGKLARRLIHILSTPTPAGVVYAVDLRLRPRGASGALVTSLGALAHYLEHQAWVWEYQALVRARAVAGDSDLGARFARLRAAVLVQPREARALAEAVTDMRTRMLTEFERANTHDFDLKHGLGGITDIEFMVQYLVLRWAGAHASLHIWTDNLRLLETIAALGLLPTAQCRCLHDAYFAYRAELHRCALQQIDGFVARERFAQERAQVRAIWDAVFA